MAVAQIADVQSRLTRELDEAELPVVETLLDDAELKLKTRIPDLLTKMTTGALDPDIVVMVEANAVARVIRNPEGYVQESDGNYSYMINASVASGLLSILPEEWADLGLRQGAFVIRPQLGRPVPRPDPWIWETL